MIFIPGRIKIQIEIIVILNVLTLKSNIYLISFHATLTYARLGCKIQCENTFYIS